MEKLKKANKVFKKINKDLSKKYTGKIVAIDPESGEYFIGNSALEAYEEGIKKHPGKEFFFKRVGAKHTFVVGAF